MLAGWALFFSVLVHHDFVIQVNMRSHDAMVFAWISVTSYFISGLMTKSSSSIIRFFSLPAAIRLGWSTFLAFFLSLSAVILAKMFTGEILSLLMTQAIFFLVASLILRAGYRFAKERQLTNEGAKRTHVLIIGAGQAALTLLKEMHSYKKNRLKAKAVLDDDPSLRKRYLHGVKIVGGCDEIDSAIKKYHIELVIIAIPSLKNKKLIASISNACLDAGVELRLLPGLSNLVDGKVSINALRHVEVEDLLGRKPIVLDKHAISDSIQGLCVLVTGGGGSIGSELCRQIANYEPERLIIVEHSEYNLYAIERDLKNRFPHIVVIPRLGSVTDDGFVNSIMELYKPHLIFHAAAYKHVPLLEEQPLVAMNNNIKGTWVMVQAAMACQVSKFVLISTDKAVNPANVMGATKRVAELICQRYTQQTTTRFSIVRFGNVLDSVGSVIPVFRTQIEAGGPVTVTHREITRYFMMIPEACQLILKAMQLEEEGKIFVLDMGEPIKIDDLAKNMIRLSGKKLGEDMDIVYTGLRPGEKLYEELFHEQENLKKTKTEGIFFAQSRNLDWRSVDDSVKGLFEALLKKNKQEAVHYLKKLVPEARLSSDLDSVENQTMH
jgi:FlaA1/EpsC-like NDP-sugar epimerase